MYAKNEITITKCGNYNTDKSLVNSRKDFDLKIPDYETMFQEMKNWSDLKQIF